MLKNYIKTIINTSCHKALGNNITRWSAGKCLTLVITVISILNIQSVFADDDKCDADFTSFQFTDKCNGEVFFTNSSNTLNANFHWNFGDGDYSLETSPFHTYEESGYYFVGMKMTTEDSCSDFHYDTIYVCADKDTINEPCVANFTYEIYPDCYGFVSFVNTSTPDPANFTATWYFGDGSSNTYINGENPVHQYSVSGTYIVELRITGDNYCNTKHFDTVKVCADSLLCDIEAEFSHQAAEYPENKICFKTVLDPDIDNYTYRFGDGQSGSPVYNNPEICHTYEKPGKYEACLKVYDYAIPIQDTCKDEVCKVVYVGYVKEVGPGTIGGSVDYKGSGKTDYAGEMGVKIRLLDEEEELVDIIYTDENGAYSFEELPYGTYQVVPEMSGRTTHPAYAIVSEEVENIDQVNFKIDENTITPTGIKEIDMILNRVSLYPNPVQNQLSINFESLENLNGTILIINHLGQTVVSQRLTVKSGQNSVDLQTNNIPTGTYFIAVNINNNIEMLNQFLKY